MEWKNGGETINLAAPPEVRTTLLRPNYASPLRMLVKDHSYPLAILGQISEPENRSNTEQQSRRLR